MFITERPIDLHEFCGMAPPPDCGGTALFLGRVRNHDGGKRVSRLFYECYVPMAERQIQQIIDAVKIQTNVQEIRVTHRIGRLAIGDIAVAISAGAAHRGGAFTACRQVIERIKQDVPIWKREVYEDGSSEWVLCSCPAEVIA